MGACADAAGRETHGRRVEHGRSCCRDGDEELAQRGRWRRTAERGHGRVREAEETDAEELEIEGAEELAHEDDVDANGRA